MLMNPKDPGNGVDSEVPPKEHHEVEHVKDLENPRKEDVPPKEEVETLEGSEEPVKDAMDEVPQEEVEPEHPRKDDREEVPPKEEVEPEDPRKEDREEVPPKEEVETEDVIEEEREVQPPKDDQEVEVSEEKPVEEPTHGVQSAKRKLEELEKPPLVLRCEQWAAKPVKPKAKAKATAKSAAKSTAKSAAKRSKRKQQDPVEIVDSEDEKQEPVEQEQKDVPKPKRKTRARVAKAAKVKDETEEQGEAKKVDPPIKYQPLTAQGKHDIQEAYKWEEGKEPPEVPFAQAAANGSDTPVVQVPKSFARRPYPRSSPAKERWFAIRDTFDDHIREWVQWYGLQC